MKKLRVTGGRLLIFIIFNLVIFPVCGDWAWSASASADQIAGGAGSDQEPGAYQTPLAGEERNVTFMGEKVLIPARDRGQLTSLTVGGSFLEPDQGGTHVLPIAALFLRRVWEDARTRDMISLLVNELEYDKSLGPLELISHFENYTLPDDQTEVVDNRELKETSLTWGTLVGSVGPGLRLPVSPYQVDNHARLQLLGRLGYFYADRTDETGPGLVVPSDTLLYGARLRGSYDGMRRNLLELPHRGVASGWNLDYMHRDRWRDLTKATTGDRDRNYLQLSGYLVGAGGMPGLSERDRLLIAIYGGLTSEKGADRFNAFRINGGPFPSEEGDLGRPHYTGILYDNVLATSYATASLGYRRELLFFLYFTMVGSYLWADRASVEGVDQVVFRDERGAAATASLDCAFFGNSSIYLAYSWESGFIRGGKSGSGITLLWNKQF